MKNVIFATVLAASSLLLTVPSQAGEEDESYPVGVWCQSPNNAARYKEIGVNVYIALWQGPTAEQVAELEKVGMPFYSELNEYAKENLLNNPIVKGWLLPDEPDNAHGWDRTDVYPEGWLLTDARAGEVPMAPSKVQKMADGWRAVDPLKKPVFLNLGWGVAWDGWYGRGVRTNKPEDYPIYAAAADILSYDIYPISCTSGFRNERLGRAPELAGDLSLIARGIKRLREWVKDEKPVWFAVEAARIEGRDVVTPQQLRDSVWMALSSGAKGIVYFCHAFSTTGQYVADDSPLRFPELGLADAMKEINADIQKHKAILLTTDLPKDEMHFEVAGDAKILLSERLVDGKTYLFVTSLSKEEQGGIAIKFNGKDTFEARQIAGSVPEPNVRPINFLTVNLPPFATRLFEIVE